MIKLILGLFVVFSFIEAGVYAINIGVYTKKENAEKVLKKFENINGVDLTKLVVVARKKSKNSFMLRSQNYDTYKKAVVQQKAIHQLVSDAFIVERKYYVKEVKKAIPIKVEPIIVKKVVQNIVKPKVNKITKVNMNRDDKKVFQDAVSNFNAKNYQKSFDLLSKIFLRHLSDEQMNFYLGRSAFELKMYDVALSAYERILISKPDNLRTRLEAARTLFHLKSFKDSKKEFASIAKLDLSKNVRANVERYLVLLEKLTKKKSLSGMFMGGISYDSNANNGALDNSYYLPIINDVLPGTKKDGDTAHQEVVMLNHIRPIGDSEKFAIKNSVMLFSKTMTDQSDKNVVLTGWTPSLMYKTKKMSAELALGYNTMWFGSDSYLSTLMFNPKFNYMVNKTLSFSGQYRWQKKKNEVATNSQRDSHVKGVNIVMSKKLPYGIKLSASYGLDKERRIRGARTDVNQDISSYSLAINKVWDKTLSLNVGYNFRNPQYIEVDRSFFTKREDKSKTYSLGFTKKLEKTLIVNAKYARVKNLSNQGPFSYEKDIVGLNIIKLFI